MHTPYVPKYKGKLVKENWFILFGLNTSILVDQFFSYILGGKKDRIGRTLILAFGLR
jgi:hypothetical protein